MANSSEAPTQMWDLLPSLIWASAPDGTYTFFNRRWLDFRGRTLAEETGDGWFEGLHPEDRDRRFSVYKAALATREPFHIEYRLRDRNGDYRWVADEATPFFDANGAFNGFLGCCLTIDATKKESKASNASDSLPGRSVGTPASGIFHTNPQGGCREVDEWWTVVTGMESERAMGGGWFQAVHPDDRAATQEKFENAFRERKPYAITCRLVDYGGAETRVHFLGEPQIDEGGVLTGYKGSIIDVARSKVARSTPSTTNRVETLNILAGSIAHDFNNQLTPILLNLSMAQDLLKQESGEFIPDIAHRLRESEEAALEAKKLANRLLAFGKAGNPVKEVMDTGPLIESVVNSALHGTGAKLDLSIAKNLRKANIDRYQLSEAIHNIVTNAVDAMDGTGIVHVSVSNVEEVDEKELPHAKGPHISIRIEDEGPGVQFGAQDRIFDPFFSTKSDGTGLGLSTAQALVRNHMGDIVFSPGTALGATFTIYIPAHVAVPAVPAEKAASGAPAEKSKAKPRSASGILGRVLIMDDEELVRSSMEAILKAYGYEVETARNGEEALDVYSKARAANNPIDCALMDLTIHGGMGGKEAICRLKQIDPEAVAVVCSGYSNDMIMSNFRNYGFQGAIQKPFEPDELNRVIQGLIHS